MVGLYSKVQGASAPTNFRYSMRRRFVPENTKHKISPKVVHLESESHRMTRARLARLPAPVHAVHEKSQLLLAQKLKVFFDRADDSLFEMADKAHSNQEQNLFFDSMREVRVQRRGIEKRFTEALEDAFAALIVSPSESAASASADDFTVDGLSLVENDDLEEMVALDNSINRANAEFGEAVQQISLRLDSLVPVKVYQKNNPVGPDLLCQTIMTQVKKLDVGIKAKLILFKLFDKVVIAGLGEVYGAINQLLVDHNVLPSLSSTTRSGQRHGRRASDRAGDAGQVPQNAAAPSADQQAPAQEQRQAGTPDRRANPSGQFQSQVAESATQSHLSPEVIAALQGLFGNNTQSNSSAGLLNVLSLAQRLPMPATTSASGINVRALISDIQQRQGGTDTQIARMDEEVINLVNMLFEFILDDRNLAKPMKALISRMQIPVIKVALLDKSFFTKGGHAARRLLNEMSKAALGWQGDSETGKRDPLYRKMDEIVRKLLNEFDTDVSLFSDLLADFSSFIEKEKRRSAVLERRTLDAEDGKAKAEVARATVALEIELRTVNEALPEVVYQLIDSVWSNVLFVTSLKHGYKSEAWLGSLKTLEDLVWSVKIPATDEERKQLIRLVPDLLKRLRAGFDSISFNPYEMSTLFKSLEDVHLACIRGVEVKRRAPAGKVQKTTAAKPQVAAPQPAQNEEPAAKPAPVAKTAAPAPVAPTVEAPQPAAKQAAAPTQPAAPVSVASPAPAAPIAPVAPNDLPDTDADMRQVAGFVQGAWFEMVDDKNSVVRCRLAAFIKPTGKYIFVNRNGMKVAEKTQQELALALKKNRLRALDNSVLFDRALETVVSGMRKPRN